MEEKITLNDFEKLCKQLFEQRAVVARIEAELDVEKGILEALKKLVMTHLEAEDKDKYQVKGHGTLYTVDRFTVPTPKSVEAKKQFGKWLNDKGTFWEFMSVNSQVLNKLYKDEMEKAVAEGNVNFKIPGIGEPSHVKSLHIRSE